MTIDNDADKLEEYIDLHHIDGSTHRTRGWESIGAIVVDACLQRRQRYRSTVHPRVASLVELWPDAASTEGFRQRLNTGELPRLIRWKSAGRLVQIENVTAVLEREGIGTVSEFRKALEDQSSRASLRTSLRAVRNVGPKTLDYFDILCGLSTGVAVDVRIQQCAREAGINDLSYDHLASVVREAARRRGWRPGDLDAALWER